jgi:hypothetical protein
MILGIITTNLGVIDPKGMGTGNIETANFGAFTWLS